MACDTSKPLKQPVLECPAQQSAPTPLEPTSITGQDCAGNALDQQGIYVKHIGKIQAELCSQDLGIEASLAPLGCIYGTNGDFLGKVFVCKIIDEKTGDTTYSKVAQFTDGTEIQNYTGTWSNCEIIPEPEIAKQYYIEIYRLDGNATTTAIPEIPIHAGNASLQNAVAGNSTTITGLRRAISWRFLRQTQQDAKLEINSIGYQAGQGEVYLEGGYNEWITDENGNFNYEKKFTVSAGAYVEIHVQREI